uniref:Uncharacterized protein n=1 Tax=Arundo donax TaxID=35708 RepID=A0A0A8YWD1_ARUDO
MELWRRSPVQETELATCEGARAVGQ